VDIVEPNLKRNVEKIKKKQMKSIFLPDTYFKNYEIKLNLDNYGMIKRWKELLDKHHAELMKQAALKKDGLVWPTLKKTEEKK